MKAKKLLLMFLLCFFAANTFSQLKFINQYSGSGTGGNVSNAVIVDDAGNSYVTGYSTGMGTGHDITTLKYNSSGRLMWSQTYNGPGNSTDEAYAITLDGAGNVYITGTSVGSSTNNDMITIKYNNSGVQLWLSRYTSPGSFPDVAYAITLDGTDNPIITGYSNPYGDGSQMTVIKYNTSNGNLIWVHNSDGNLSMGGGTDVAYAITIDASDNIYITGYYKSMAGDLSTSSKQIKTVKFNSSGEVMWSKLITGSGDGDNEPASMLTDSAGNIYVTGYITSANKGKDYITVKYNPAGIQLWQQTYNYANANDDDMAKKIIIDRDGNILVTGSSKHSHQVNSEDYMTIKYNGSTGALLFASRYTEPGLNSASIAYSIAEYKKGKYYVTGSSRQSNTAGSEDIVTLEYKKDGTLKNKFMISNPGTDAAYDIKTDRDGDFVLSGYVSGNSPGLSSGSMTYMTCAMYTDNSTSSNNNLLIIKNTESGIPKGFSLQQNYPNPFNPSTVIKFDVSQSSAVKIVIYDVLGKEVYTAVNDFMNAGTYEVSVSMHNLSSGLYFYKMTSGSFTDIKKMMLTK